MSVLIRGIIEENFFISNKKFGEVFYRTTVEVKRKGGKRDHLPVMVSECNLKARMSTTPMKGRFVKIRGEINTKDTKNSGVKLFILAESIEICTRPDYANEVHIEGQICKPPVCRSTRKNEQLTELLVATEMDQERHYIPCIVWGKMAKEAAQYKYKDNIVIYGKLQSRDYDKRLDSGATVTRRTYEVVVKKIE